MAPHRVVFLSDHLITDCDFELFDGLGEIGVFFFFLLEELQGLNIFAEFIREMIGVI